MPLRTIAGTTDRRIAALLALLADKPMIVISGAKIAEEIGVSRSTVWRWVQTLRSLGVEVKGHARTGYVIEKTPDVLAPNLFRRSLRHTTFGKHIYHFFKIDSTNRVALQLGHEGEPHGTVVLAEEQTAGRGRAGRVWHSERASGIYMTVLMRPGISPADAPLLTLLAGLSVRDAIQEQAGITPDLRWPNDLLLNGKKLGGILTEMHAEPERVQFVIIGIGLNVNHARMPENLSEIATSLRMESGRSHSRLELAVKLLGKLESYYNQFLENGPQAILDRFAEVSTFALGKRVRIANSRETFTGTTAGLASNGLLRVKREDGRTETVISGDVAEAL
ncbi:MAG TPA: biotin--[acetyl-CoA-carboxylase] ligase [Candidatus Dormibacteraeota bacterium]|nr:biotin--[acetyl-CoA-carboxylase] ligase [Candidatus Dormibacteraeota bacterium]